MRRVGPANFRRTFTDAEHEEIQVQRLAMRERLFAEEGRPSPLIAIQEKPMTETAKQPNRCPHCAGEPEPGWIETENNGPIVPCPVCNPISEFDLAYDRALAQRAQGKAGD